MKKAEIIKDSICNDNRITTFVVHLPRMVLSEFNTHRALSRNSSSSRAIPYVKMRKLVKNAPYVPKQFLANHKGMQGTKIHSKQKLCKFWWLLGLRFAIMTHWLAEKIGVTKQIGNRVLEPWMYQKILVTATDWENFFRLRNHPDAQGEIKDVAKEMEKLYKTNIPKKLQQDEWHIPFDNDLKSVEIYKTFNIPNNDYKTINEIRRKICVARCARVSYNNFYGKRNLKTDVDLYNKLVESVPVHASPTEHIAKAMNEKELKLYSKTDIMSGENKIISGSLRNFRGWIQLRAYIKKDTQL